MTLTRVPVLTACTLASLAVGELSTKAKAIASPAPETEATYLIKAKAVAISLEEPVALPEMSSAEFAPATSLQLASLATDSRATDPVVAPVATPEQAAAGEAKPVAPIATPVQSATSAATSQAPATASVQSTPETTTIVSSPQPSQRSSLPPASLTIEHPSSTLQRTPRPSTPTANPTHLTPSATQVTAEFTSKIAAKPTVASAPTQRRAISPSATAKPTSHPTRVATKPSPPQVRKSVAPRKALSQAPQSQPLDWQATPKPALAQTVRVASTASVAPPETLVLPPARSQQRSNSQTVQQTNQQLAGTIGQPNPTQLNPTQATQTPQAAPQLSRQATALGGPIELASATSAIELTPASPQVPVQSPAQLAGIAPPEAVVTPERQELAQTPPGSSVPLVDIQGNWAEDFITYLAERDVVRGFPDRTFQPEASITRVQLAAILQKAFATSVQPVREPTQFADVPVTYWGYNAIQSAYQRGFLEKYADNTFRPDQVISRIQALTALAQGLNLTPTQIKPEELTNYFQDAEQISPGDRSVVAASLENRLVVNYPDVRQLEPNQIASRADVSAVVYQALVRLNQAPALPETSAAARYIATPTIATAPPTETPPPVTAERVRDVQTRLQTLQETAIFGDIFRGSPGITIANPSGFGADNQTGFISATYQAETRGTDEDDGAFGLGVGFGDARRAVGVEVSYTFASFGGSRDFGTGGFNLKVHRQFPQDFAVALGWNGLINIGDDNDFEDSPYAVVTKVFRTQANINRPFSRVAVSGGLGSGQFRTADDIEDDRDTINPFGSVAIRIARPISFITEWTGQDLALGFSIAPFQNFNLVITPALRDVAGEGDGARFVLGVGTSFSF